MNQNSIKLILLLGIFLFGSVVISQSGVFSQARVDLTENQLFTLNQGTLNIIESIDERIQLKLYFSDDASSKIPFLRTYKNRVVDLITEMVKASSGKLDLIVLDPIMFTPEEDEAAQYGLQAVPIGDTGDSIFFGLVGENTLDQQEIIPFIQPERENFLEYDVAELIDRLNNPQRKKIGVLSSLPLEAQFDSITGERIDEQVILTQLKKTFDVQILEQSIESIDDSLDLLMIVHPKIHSEKQLFAIDQYVMKGGSLVVFVDPYAQSEAIERDPDNPMAFYQADRSSNIKVLFDNWGVNYNQNTIVLDEQYAISVQSPQNSRRVKYLAYLGLTGESLNQDDIVNRELDLLKFVSVGYFESEKLQPILQTSENPSLIDSKSFRVIQDFNSLYNNYQPLNRKLMIAGRLNGAVKSAFSEGLEGIDSKLVIQENDSPKVVLFADVDFLFDPLWVRSQNYFMGRKVYSAQADNGNLIVNVMENMSGSSDLINIRGRKSSARPFTKVIELQNQSNKKFRETENLLKQKLIETEQKLNELQRQKGEQNRLILSPEQELELQNFQDEKADVRKKLREVRRNLDKDIKELGVWLKFINIGLIPLIICLFGAFALWLMPRKRGGKYAK